MIFLDADPIWWGRRQDANGAQRTVWMGDDRVFGYADHFVQSTTRHPMQDLAKLIEDCGHGQSRTGVEFDNYFYSAKAHITLTTELPGATLIDATALVNWQRVVKSDEEIALMRKAARFQNSCLTACLNALNPACARTSWSHRYTMTR